MKLWLLDGSVLFALVLETHIFHRRVSVWWASQASDARFATCPVTEGTLLRLHMMQALDTSAAAAWLALDTMREHPRQVFWPDNFSYTEIDHTRLTGHRQITDAKLAELARRKGGG